MRTERLAAAAGALLALAAVACTPVVDTPPAFPTHDPTYVYERLPKGVVTGRVVDRATGKGLAGAAIAVQNVDPPVQGVADGAGAFVLPEVPQGKQIVVVTMPGYHRPAAWGAVIADVMPRTTVSMGDIALAPGPSPSPAPSPSPSFSPSPSPSPVPS